MTFMTGLNSAAAAVPRISIPADASTMLSERPEIHRLLVDAAARLGNLFPGAPLRVALQQDESGAHSPEIILSAVTDLGLAEAFDRLDRFDDEWWLDASSQSNGLITVTVERP
jgi:hypothetical protein